MTSHLGKCLTFNYELLLGEEQNATIKCFEKNDIDRLLSITWSDGKKSQFAYVWLRDYTPDHDTYSISEALTVRKLYLKDLDLQEDPTTIELLENGKELQITWSGNSISIYPALYLRYRDLSCAKMRQLRRQLHFPCRNLWRAEEMKEKLKKHNFKDIQKNPAALSEWLTEAITNGVAMIENAQHDENGINQIIDLIGINEDTHYGKTFEVKVQDEPMNAAYGEEARKGLPSHTDDTSLYRTPDFQMLLSREMAYEGGATPFSDGFQIARDLQNEHRWAFDLLSSIEYESIQEGYVYRADKSKYTFKFVAMKKVIEYDSEKNEMKTINYNNHMRSYFIDCHPSKLQKYYEALMIFEKMVTSDKYCMPIILQPGEAILWDNTRIIHGRHAYKIKDKDTRCLSGCYFRKHHLTSRIREINTRIHSKEDQPSL